MEHLRSYRKINERRTGQSIIELALMLPVLLLLVVGVIDLGRVFFSYQAVVNAAREGARYAAMNPTDTAGITRHAAQEANGTGLVLVVATPECFGPGGACASSYAVRVTVTFDFRLLTMQIFGSGTIRLTSSSQMVIF
jgi:Flp pilus assembly protein TadG